jgi:hypothetical protein
MSTEENIDQEPESNEAADPVNQTILQDQSIEHQSENMEVFHHPDLHHKKNIGKNIS